MYLALGLIAAAATRAGAWSCDGHMAVAQVALDSGLMSAKVFGAAKDLVDYLNAQYPYTGTTFQEIACWADDIKSQEPATAGWHFIVRAHCARAPAAPLSINSAPPFLQDIPVCHLSNPADCTPPEPQNVVWAIDTAESTLEAPGSAQLDRARMLRFLVHFAGDIHQPLHAANYFSSQFPTGDLGGNKWPISGAPPPATNLHSFWDEGLGQWTQNLRRPLNSTGFAWLESLSAKVTALHPVSELQPFIDQHNASVWAQESYQIAADFVYTAPQAPTDIPAAYTQQGSAIALKQIAIAGYRLATALEQILSS